jgi:hypothetical protein
MSKSYAQEIIAALNTFLLAKGHPKLEDEVVMFVMDDDITYEGDCIVSASKLIKPELLDKLIEPLVSTGPSWIHANLISTTNHRSLITLRFGALVGNPLPNINVSYESNKIAKVFNDNDQSL